MPTQLKAEFQIDNSHSTRTSTFLKTDGADPMEGQLDMNSNGIASAGTIGGVSTPSSSDEATPKSYVDSAIDGLDRKESVRAATDGTNLALDGTDSDTIDGVTLVSGDRLLLKDQSTASENGIYVVDSVSSSQISVSRAPDADEDSEVTAGMEVSVVEGTANSDTRWFLVTDDSITVGTTDLNFSILGAGSVKAGSGLTKSGDTLNVNAADNSLTINSDDMQVSLSSAGTIEVDGGLEVKKMSEGNVLLGQGTSTATAETTLSGDVSSVSKSGDVTLDSTIARKADYVAQDDFSTDGATTTFTLTNDNISGTDSVHRNGQRLTRVSAGSEDEGSYSIDETATPSTITIGGTTPASDEEVFASYFKA